MLQVVSKALYSLGFELFKSSILSMENNNLLYVLTTTSHKSISAWIIKHQSFPPCICMWHHWYAAYTPPWCTGMMDVFQWCRSHLTTQITHLSARVEGKAFEVPPIISVRVCLCWKRNIIAGTGYVCWTHFLVFAFTAWMQSYACRDTIFMCS